MLLGIAAIVLGLVLVVGRADAGVAAGHRARLTVTHGTDLDERIALLGGAWLFSACSDDELERIAALASRASRARATS